MNLMYVIVICEDFPLRQKSFCFQLYAFYFNFTSGVKKVPALFLHSLLPSIRFLPLSLPLLHPSFHLFTFFCSLRNIFSKFVLVSLLHSFFLPSLLLPFLSTLSLSFRVSTLPQSPHSFITLFLVFPVSFPPPLLSLVFHSFTYPFLRLNKQTDRSIA